MSFHVERDVMIPMRDGVKLSTDLWIPDGDAKVPALLVRIPYAKNLFPGTFNYPLNPNIFTLLDAGYAVVWQDTRGSFGSEGEFGAMAQEPNDGEDTIAWLRDQSWCDGSLGTYGPSYLGFVQWASASRNPEGLKAIAPTVTTSDYYRAPWYSEGGVISWHSSWWWSTLMGVHDGTRDLSNGHGPATLLAFAEEINDPDKHLNAMPYGDKPLLTKRWPWWSEWINHAERDEYWQEMAAIEKVQEIRVPALNIGGWFDIMVSDTVRSFTRMSTDGGSPSAREGQRLIIGPWDHLLHDGVYPDRQFGPTANAAAVDLTSAYLAFFDRWIRGRSDALEGSAPVRIFVMGIDEWRDEIAWPLPDTQYVDYFLDSDGNANSSNGNGRLVTTQPTATSSDSFIYDPMNPVPTIGGRTLMPAAMRLAGPADQRAVEERDDVLCFTTNALIEAVEVTGHVSLVLQVSSSATDTDFTGKLVDVFPDGRAVYLTDGILRTRYRDSLSEPVLMKPGEIVEITIDMSVTSNVFLPGHRIRLEVSSSNFPRFGRNTNSGGQIATDDLDDVIVASNTVLHGPGNSSRLIMPIIRR